MWKLVSKVYLISIIVFVTGDDPTGMLQKSFGSCKAGTIYRIRERKDLLENAALYPELECIFTAGKIPSKVPYGTYNLEIVKVFSTRMLNPLFELIFTGKYVTRVKCNLEENGTMSSASILWNNMGGTPRMPAGVRLGNANYLIKGLDEGEYYDGRDSLIIDYGDDVASRCPGYATPAGQHGLIVPKTETGNFYPLDLAFDLVRLVGVQESDGGRIYLGKVYMRSPFEAKVGVLAYITFIIYDMEVNPSFGRGEALDPLPKSYNYTIGSLMDLLGKVFPISKFIGLSPQTRPTRMEARAEFYSLISRNRQLANSFRSDRRNDGVQLRKTIDRRFSAAFKESIYQK